MTSEHSKRGEVDGEASSRALDRRQFLYSASLLGLAAATRTGDRGPMAGTPVAPIPATSNEAPFALAEATIDEMQAGMQSGELTSRALVEAYLARVAAIDAAGPHLRSIIELNPDVLKIAADLDAERKATGPRGPLHGIPVVLKDVVDTADRMHTTAGSLALMGSIPREDAFIVRRLRAAGAVILAKTNLSEWSFARSTRASSGWSARGGLTVNPYALDRSAMGSSSGSAVAVSANLAAIGIGVETDGSIVGPASASGLVGVKPTVGLCSRTGLIPLSRSQDTAGPMCRTVRDAAILLGVIAGADPSDIATDESGGHVLTDYASELDAGALKGARLGVLRRYFDSDAREYGLLARALDVMRSAGATVVDPIEIATLDHVRAPEAMVMLCEFKDLIADYLATRGPTERIRSLRDIMDFNVTHADQELRLFGQEWFESSEATDGRRTPGYRQAVVDCRRLTRDLGYDLAAREHQLDAIVVLTGPPPFPFDLVNGDPQGNSSTSLAAVSGYPSITVPMGAVMGLPVGISFIGSAWSEARILSLAYAFEQATHARRPPAFHPTVLIDG